MCPAHLEQPASLTESPTWEGSSLGASAQGEFSSLRVLYTSDCWDSELPVKDPGMHVALNLAGTHYIVTTATFYLIRSRISAAAPFSPSHT